MFRSLFIWPYQAQEKALDANDVGQSLDLLLPLSTFTSQSGAAFQTATNAMMIGLLNLLGEPITSLMSCSRV